MNLTCANVGNYSATIFVEDGSGNIGNCTSTLTILDTIDPTISCNAATLYLDAIGNLVVDTNGLINSFGDNCGIDSVWVDANDVNLTCADTGTYFATIFVEDVNGNISSCISTLNHFRHYQPNYFL